MKYNKELKIGFFVTAVLIVSFFMINYLRGEDIFNTEIEVSSRYGDVQGLVPSAPVYIKGFKAGKVSEVNYDIETEDFEVICSVKKDFKIPTDSKMTIYSVDIMGGKGVRIDLGQSGEVVRDGGTLTSDFEAGLMDVLATGVGLLLEKVTLTMDSLAVTVSGVNRMLSDSNQEHMSRTLEHLEQTMATVSNVASGLDGRSEELDTFIVNLASLSDKFASIADKVDTTMTNISTVTGSLSESDLQGIVSSLNELLENLNDPDGTIGKLFVDNSIYDSVDSLLSDIDDLVRKIQENPKQYLRISVF